MVHSVEETFLNHPYMTTLTTVPCRKQTSWSKESQRKKGAGERQDTTLHFKQIPRFS